MTLEGNPWFVAADVCRALGLSLVSGTTNHLLKLDADEKMQSPQPIQGMRGASPTLISESGLNRIVLRADSMRAKPFQDWVTKEVLPSIRKTGSFVTGQPSLVENPQMSAIPKPPCKQT